MSLQAVRVERDRLRSLLRVGANPAQVARVEKTAHGERSANTFSAICLQLQAKRTKDGLSPGSVVRARRLIEKGLAGLADLPIGDITAPALLTAPAVLIVIRPKILPGRSSCRGQSTLRA